MEFSLNGAQIIEVLVVVLTSVVTAMGIIIMITRMAAKTEVRHKETMKALGVIDEKAEKSRGAIHKLTSQMAILWTHFFNKHT